MYSNTGNYNTAVGSLSLQANTTASNNTAVGYAALYANTTGTANTAIGNQSGLANTTSSYSTYLGYVAGEVATGEKNTFLGQGSGSSVTSGDSNTIIGRYNGNQNGLDIRTASNNIVLSDGDGYPAINTVQSANTLAHFDVTQNTGSGTNVISIAAGTTITLFQGASTFSGFFVLNEILRTGDCAVFVTGGGAVSLIDQSATQIVKSPTPGTSEIGVFVDGTTIKVKNGRTDGVEIRIIAFRTRNAQ